MVFFIVLVWFQNYSTLARCFFLVNPAKLATTLQKLTCFQDLCGPVMDAMRWLDAYLDEHLAMQQQPPQLAPRDMYYTEGPALEQDVMISGQGYAFL